MLTIIEVNKKLSGEQIADEMMKRARKHRLLDFTLIGDMTVRQLGALFDELSRTSEEFLYKCETSHILTLKTLKELKYSGLTGVRLKIMDEHGMSIKHIEMLKNLRNLAISTELNGIAVKDIVEDAVSYINHDDLRKCWHLLYNCWGEDVAIERLMIESNKTPRLTYRNGGSFLIIEDCRRKNILIEHKLFSSERDIYLYCMNVKGFKSIVERFRNALKVNKLKKLLEELCALDLLYHSQGSYLSLAMRDVKSRNELDSII